MDLKRWLYERSPVFVQNVGCTLLGWQKVRRRYDARFEQRCAFYRQAARWSRAEAEAFQAQRLAALARHAYEHVPYYRRAFDAAGLRPEDLRAPGDLPRLPLLSKDDVRRAGTDLIASPHTPGTLVPSHSGGSTGMPLTCYHTPEALREVYAAFWVYHRPGVTRHDRYATFQGLPLIPPGQRGGPYWRSNRAMHQRLYSIFHLGTRTVREYLADLDAYRPVYLAGYANSLYLLAKLAEEAGCRPAHAPRAVFSTSEQLLPAYRETIARVFRTRVWDAYSQDETVASISEYECGWYHVDHAYGVVEFLDLEQHGPRRVAEIVCTGLLNPAWPLIRYQVGDIVEYEPLAQCPRCGRAGPVIYEIRGRTGDVVVTPSGRHFPHISLLVKDLHGVRQFQIVQHALDHIRIRYVPSEDFDPEHDEERMRAIFSRALNEPLRWTIERVAEIPRTAAGKFLSIISELPRAERPAAPAPAATPGP